VPPDNLVKDVKAEVDKHPERRTASDLEAMTYLNTAASAAPLSDQWTRIYMYVCREYMVAKFGKVPEGTEFLNEYKTLRPDDVRELDHLKDWIFRAQQRELKKKASAGRVESAKKPEK